MIPLRDDQPTSSFPILTILLIAANIYIFVQQALDPTLTPLYSLIPYSLTHGHDLGYREWLIEHMKHSGEFATYAVQGSTRPLWSTLFTCMFLHAGLLHIGGNMLFLWIFGNNIEDVLGKVRFIFFYFACGLAASLSMVFTEPNSQIPTLGASGAIAGVLGAYFILFPKAKVLSIVPICFLGFLAEIRAFWVLSFWIAINIVQSLQGTQAGGVAYIEHVTGFLTGMLLIILLGGRKLTGRSGRRMSKRTP